MIGANMRAGQSCMVIPGASPMPKSAERYCAGSNYVVVRWIVARHIAMTQFA